MGSTHINNNFEEKKWNMKKYSEIWRNFFLTFEKKIQDVLTLSYKY